MGWMNVRDDDKFNNNKFNKFNKFNKEYDNG